jgi:hydrogenase expression/formation protein HypC
MCQAQPLRLQRIEGDVGWVDLAGQEAAVSLIAVEGVAVGDYLICHAGLALERLDAEQAEALIAALREIENLLASSVEG